MITENQGYFLRMNNFWWQKKLSVYTEHLQYDRVAQWDRPSTPD